MYIFVNCKCAVEAAEAAEEVSMHSQWWGSRSGFWEWAVDDKHLCNTCMLQIPHMHMPGCPSFIYAFVHFFSVVHLNLCTWNLRLCNPAGWVRNCAHRNWISATDYNGRVTLQCSVTTSWDQSPWYMEEGEDVETCWPLELVWGT